MNVLYEEREKWAKSFFRENTNVQLWKLDHTEDDRLCVYVTKDKIVSGKCGNEDMLGRLPVWHVWDGNEWLYCGQSQSAAYNVYRNCLQHLNNKT